MATTATTHPNENKTLVDQNKVEKIFLVELLKQSA